MAAPNLDVAHLRSLIAIVEQGGFARAAAHLRLSQPSVSHHIRQLERRIGRPLFAPAGRQVQLTADGERALAEARILVGTHDEALARLSGPAREQAPVIGITEFLYGTETASLVTRLSEALSSADAVFRVAGGTRIRELMQSGAIDYMVVAGVGTGHPGSEVARVPLAWFAGPKWRRPGSGGRLPLVLRPEPCSTRALALGWARSAGYEPAPIAEAENTNGLIALARALDAVTVLSTHVDARLPLRRIPEFPEPGFSSVRLSARPGLDPEIEHRLSAALTDYFAEPQLRAVSA